MKKPATIITRGIANMAAFTVAWPAGPMAAAVSSPRLIPETIRAMLIMPVDRAPPILLTRGWMEKVTDSFRLRSFYCSYYTASTRNFSLTICINL